MGSGASVMQGSAVGVSFYSPSGFTAHHPSWYSESSDIRMNEPSTPSSPADWDAFEGIW